MGIETMTKNLHGLWLCVLLGLPPGGAWAQTEASAGESAPAARAEQSTAETLLDRARAAFAAGACAQAIDLATQWLQQEPQSADRYWLRGVALAEGPQDYEGAVADLADSNRLAPKFAGWATEAGT